MLSYEISNYNILFAANFRIKRILKRLNIANILAKDKTTISRTLATLEKKGFILKKQIDKRTNLIELTNKLEELQNEQEEQYAIWEELSD